MYFNYTKKESDVGSIYLPVIPIIINGFPVGNALIDTGCYVTLLPRELNTEVLQLELDADRAIEVMGVGGARFKAIPAASRVIFTLEHSGHRPIEWKGTVYFTSGQGSILLGQHEFLSELKITLDGKNRRVRME